MRTKAVRVAADVAKLAGSSYGIERQAYSLEGGRTPGRTSQSITNQSLRWVSANSTRHPRSQSMTPYEGWTRLGWAETVT